MLHPKDLRTGHRRRSGNGYVLIYCPDHPFLTKGSGGCVLEHRLVMERHLGRYLKRGEEVHHKDEVKHHNPIGNLYLCSTVSEHKRIHRPLKPCPTCGEIHNPGEHARTHCSKCGKVVRLNGRNHFPAVCWRCRFPLRKCKICGGKHEARGFCENHYKQWKRRQINPSGQQIRPKGVEHPNCKFTERQILHVKRLLLTGMMHKEIEKKTGVPKGSVAQIAQGKSWAHLKL